MPALGARSAGFCIASLNQYQVVSGQSHRRSRRRGRRPGRGGQPARDAQSGDRCGSDCHRLLMHRFSLLLVCLAASAQGWSVTARVFAKVRRSGEQTHRRRLAAERCCPSPQSVRSTPSEWSHSFAHRFFVCLFASLCAAACARAGPQSSIRPYANERGSGQVASLTLVDASGSIKCVMFGDAVDKWSEGWRNSGGNVIGDQLDQRSVRARTHPAAGFADCAGLALSSCCLQVLSHASRRSQSKWQHEALPCGLATRG